MTGGMNDIEISAFAAPLNAGHKPDGGATDYAIISIAISLKRIADRLDDIAGGQATIQAAVSRNG